jgi:hypothetical protein
MRQNLKAAPPIYLSWILGASKAKWPGQAVATASQLTFRGLQVVTPATPVRPRFTRAPATLGAEHISRQLQAQETEVGRFVRP